MRNVLSVFAVLLLILLVALYAWVIASFAIEGQRHADWHWPAGELSIQTPYPKN